MHSTALSSSSNSDLRVSGGLVFGWRNSFFLYRFPYFLCKLISIITFSLAVQKGKYRPYFLYSNVSGYSI